MTRSNCDPCCNPTELARNESSWRDAVLQVLCLISDSGQIFTPYSASSSYVYGNNSTTGTGTTSLVAAAGGSLRNYITDISIANTGATTSLITLQDGSGGATLWQSIAPAGGGSNINLSVPIRTSANTALFFIASNASTTIYVSASGFSSL